MQAIKDKLSDMSAMRKIKAETKAEEQAEKEIAKARVEVAHEVRLAKEAEAAMEMHVQKAGEKAHKAMANHPHQHTHHEAPMLDGGSGRLDESRHGGCSLDSHSGAEASPGLRSASMRDSEGPTSGMGTPNKNMTNTVAPSTH